MFGYVKVWKPMLRVCELEAYRGIYCGLCRELGRRYGQLSRNFLSYDFTFAALLEMAVGTAPPAFEQKRCLLHPEKKENSLIPNPALSRACDDTVLTVWYKLKDNLSDGNPAEKAAASASMAALRGSYRKASAAQPEFAAVLEREIARQSALERAACPSTDEASDPSAQILASLFSSYSEDAGQKRVLGRLGYLLGRYVYLADALDDLEKDRKSHSYNPFLLCFPSSSPEEIREQARGSLYLTIGEMETVYSLLEIHYFGPILENVFALGLHHVADELFGKQKQS